MPTTHAVCKKLKGYKDQWRFRIGQWRVLYIIDDAAKLATSTRIAHRREDYEQPKTLASPEVGEHATIGA